MPDLSKMRFKKGAAASSFRSMFPKCPTGISGFDEITFGGVPRGRPTLVCGSAGCGKTLFGMEFLVYGARDLGEPGVCISFEETPGDLAQNVRSLGFDVEALIRAKKLVVDYIELDRSQIAETGEYDLEGLFIRIGASIDEVRAKRVLLDTPEALFASLSDQGILRSELRRLFAWLKSKGVTAIITGEKGEGTLTRHGLEEYVSDCVVLLDQRVRNATVTRQLRVLKYRGSTHGTNEYPFLIDKRGISVLPVTSLGLEHAASTERVSSGVPQLDEMLEGRGFFRGSSILISGGAGTGKTSMGAHFVNAACSRGESAVFFSFEESPDQLMRNMRSIGIDLARWVRKGRLHIHSRRPTTLGLEMHLVQMHNVLETYRPKAVVVDPISSLVAGGAEHEVKGMLLRVVDHMKHSGATALFTALTSAADIDSTDIDLSSLVDAWLLLRNFETGGERNRVLYLLKSRGMAHSNQVREFLLTDKGVQLREVYLGPGGVLTGSARTAQELREREEELARTRETERRRLTLERTIRGLEAQIAAIESEKASHEKDLQHALERASASIQTLRNDRDAMARSRGGDAGAGRRNGRRA